MKKFIYSLMFAVPFFGIANSMNDGINPQKNVSNERTFDACEAVDVPYIQDFESAVIPAMPECTTVENAGNGNLWETNTNGGAKLLRYKWNSSSAANTWFYTRAINLTAGESYKISYDYGTGSSSAFAENLRVAYGTSATHTAMTNVLAEHIGIVGTSMTTNEITITASATGVYYFGFQAFSDADKYYLYVDNIKVESTNGGGNQGCEAVDVPYTQNFESAIIPAMPDCTTVENLGQGNSWDTSSNSGSKSIRYAYTQEYDANTWFYTQGVNLIGGETYKISYDYASGSNDYFNERLRVSYGTTATNSAMLNVLAEHIDIRSIDYINNTVEFTPATSGVYYFGFNAYSTANNYYLYVDNINIDLAVPATGGCLDAPGGQYPSATYTPYCIGIPEVIITNGWNGEYTKVSLTAGTTYTFSSSVATDYITISDENGTTVKAFGTNSATYTPATDEIVRFYTHDDENCNYTMSPRSRMVQCGEPIVIEEPNFACFQGDGITSTFSDGYNIMAGDEFRAADNFFVEPSTEFSMQQITIDVLSKANVVNAVINIRENLGNIPGDVLETITMAPSSSEIYNLYQGYPVRHLTFDLATPISLTEGTYWLEATMTTADGYEPYWLGTAAGTHGSPIVVSTDGGVNWIADPTAQQAVFFVAGECEEMNTSDANSFNFSYYPNPVKDILTIDSEKAVKKVEIFNLAGQKVMNNAKVNNGQINVNALTPGTYAIKVTLEGGQIETFKIIKK